MDRRKIIAAMPFALGGMLAIDSDKAFAQALSSNYTVFVQSRAAMSGLNPSVQPAVVLMEAGREGLFVWQNGNFSNQIASDSAQGIYVASTTNSSNGAWVRVYDGAVSAKWFGAVGNGSVDDTAAVQAAINYVESQYTSNYWGEYFGEVFLPSGDYLITGISISSPIVFGGSGSQSCSISLASGANNNIITIAAPPASMELADSYRYSGKLRGFSINGNGGSQTSTSNGIYVSNSNVAISQRYDGSVSIEDVIVRATQAMGIYIGVNRNYGSMRKVSVVYCNIGVQNNGYDWRIADCDFGNATEACYWQFEGGATCISGTNIYMSTNSTGMVISSLVNAPCMISGCYFDSNAMNGIYVEGDGTPSVRHSVNNNIFRDNSKLSSGGYAHIFVNNLSGGCFTGNTFVMNSATPGYLIFIQGTSSIVWSGSYAQGGSSQPYTTAVCNAPSSLISG